MSLFRCVASRRALRRLNTPLTHAYHPSYLAPSTTTGRCFSNTPLTLFPRKDTQDKDSLDPSSSEYSKSGTDNATAGTDAAFDPNETRPEKEEHNAGQESGGGGDQNSLNVSPSNPEVSKPRGEQEGGSENSPRTSKSGGGSAPKAGGDKSG
ncbi:hypothetical protein BDV96DRAFT_598146 [Lophiotrema nucula]|uniref:Uncharacterized protein n=1 Tax=Lophiotrema nucula TaxID=690887 RepID=A0A6A5ZCK7_9PLEO|nr:hypothetical protein BDV96DRAFT_598146 [Lophiotrema nucula]